MNVHRKRHLRTYTKAYRYTKAYIHTCTYKHLHRKTHTLIYILSFDQSNWQPSRFLERMRKQELLPPICRIGGRRSQWISWKIVRCRLTVVIENMIIDLGEVWKAGICHCICS